MELFFCIIILLFLLSSSKIEFPLYKPSNIDLIINSPNITIEDIEQSHFYHKSYHAFLVLYILQIYY